jgi:hypothetical protein
VNIDEQQPAAVGEARRAGAPKWAELPKYPVVALAAVLAAGLQPLDGPKWIFRPTWVLLTLASEMPRPRLPRYARAHQLEPDDPASMRPAEKAN